MSDTLEMFTIADMVEAPDEARRFFSKQYPKDPEWAAKLAAIEAWMKGAGIEVKWVDDWSLGISHAGYYCDEAHPDGEPDTCESVMLLLDGEHLASFHCIDDADDDGRRLVVAECAYEAYLYLATRQ